MTVTSIKTEKILPGAIDIFSLLDESLPTLKDGDIIAITSKIVSLCENRVIPRGKISKDEIVVNESEQYLPHTLSQYGHHFTIANNTLVAMAGVDESNGDGNYILWPKDPQKSANEIREYLTKHFRLKTLGVIITDSTCQPLRRGTTGVSLAHSGFKGLRNYIGSPDLFGRALNVTQANIAGGLAATAVLVMGEGSEQTPLCILSDLSFVEFQSRNPNASELSELNISREDDLFAPFLNAVKWSQGRRGHDNAQRP